MSHLLERCTQSEVVRMLRETVLFDAGRRTVSPH